MLDEFYIAIIVDTINFKYPEFSNMNQFGMFGLKNKE